MFPRNPTPLSVSLSLLLLSSAAPAASAAQAVFTEVRGTVTIRPSEKGPEVPAKVGTFLSEGGIVRAGKGGRAVLETFEGASLTVSPETEFSLARYEERRGDRRVRVHLAVGRLLAKVRELWSPSSSFEIEAGGVVCGVRGTEFSVDYDGKNKVLLEVLKGTVFADAKEGLRDYLEGSRVQFLRGAFDKQFRGPEPRRRGNAPEGKRPGRPFSMPGGRLPGGKWSALRDLKGQFTSFRDFSADSAFVDPSLEGAVRLNIRMGIPAAEDAP